MTDAKVIIEKLIEMQDELDGHPIVTRIVCVDCFGFVSPVCYLFQNKNMFGFLAPPVEAYTMHQVRELQEINPKLLPGITGYGVWFFMSDASVMVYAP